MGTRANTQHAGLGLLRGAKLLMVVALGVAAAGAALCEHCHDIPPEDDDDIDPNDPHGDTLVLTEDGLRLALKTAWEQGAEETLKEAVRRGWRPPVAQLTDGHPLNQGRLVSEVTDDDPTPDQGLLSWGHVVGAKLKDEVS